MEQIATSPSLSRDKSVYSRKGDEPFQIIILLAVLAILTLAVWNQSPPSICGHQNSSRVKKFPEAAKMDRPH